MNLESKNRKTKLKINKADAKIQAARIIINDALYQLDKEQTEHDKIRKYLDVISDELRTLEMRFGILKQIN